MAWDIDPLGVYKESTEKETSNSWDLDPLGVYSSKDEPEDGSDFKRGFSTSFKQNPQLAYGLLGGAGAAGEKIFGEGGVSSAVKDYGIEGYRDWSERIFKDSKQTDSINYSWNKAKEGDFGALVDWLQYGAGYTIGQGIQILGTGGVVGAIGKWVGTVVAKKVASGLVKKELAKLSGEKIAKELSRDALEKLAVRNISTKIAERAGVAGQRTALAGTAFGMEGGEIFGGLVSEAAEKGEDVSGSQLAKAFGATLAAGGLEFVGDKLGFDLILGKSKIFSPAKGMTGLSGRAARGGLGAAAATPIEGGTEYAQTLIETLGQGKEITSETLKEAVDAAALGGLGGQIIGGGGGLLSSPEVAKVKKEIDSELLSAKTVDEVMSADRKSDSLDKVISELESALSAGNKQQDINDIMSDFTEQGESEIEQGSVRARREAFKKMRANLAELEANRGGSITPATSELARQAELTPAQAEAEKPTGKKLADPLKGEITDFSQTDKINGITRAVAGDMLAAGDEEVLDHIREGVKIHGKEIMSHVIRNQAMSEVGEAIKNGTDWKAVQARIKKLQPEIDKILAEQSLPPEGSERGGSPSVPAASPVLANKGMRKVTPAQQQKVDESSEMYRAAVDNPDLVGKQRADTIANLRNLTQFWQATNPEKVETGYEFGDQVAYTGVVDKGMREFIYLEGSKAGSYGVAATKEQRESNAVAKQEEFSSQQAEFRKLNKSSEQTSPAPPVTEGQPSRADEKPLASVKVPLGEPAGDAPSTQSQGEKQPKTEEKAAEISSKSDSEVFLRKPTQKEIGGGTARSRGFNSLPEAPEGFENVYKPYGSEGKGYYRVAKRQEAALEKEAQNDTLQRDTDNVDTVKGAIPTEYIEKLKNQDVEVYRQGGKNGKWWSFDRSYAETFGKKVPVLKRTVPRGVKLIDEPELNKKLLSGESVDQGLERLGFDGMTRMEGQMDGDDTVSVYIKSPDILTSDTLEDSAAPTQVSEESQSVQKDTEVSEAGENESRYGITDLGTKSIFVAGDPAEIRAKLATAGVKNKGSVKKNGLMFSKRNEAEVRGALEDKVSFAKDTAEKSDFDKYTEALDRTEEDNKKLATDAVKYFGITYRPEEAGYILPSGEMLDFSGKHQVGPSQRRYMRERQVDHRELHGESMLEPDLELDISQGGYWGMVEFMARTGAIRFDFNSGIVNAFSVPTAKQIKVIGDALRGKDITVELVDKKITRVIDSAEINNATPQKISRFFSSASGKKADRNSPLFAKGTVSKTPQSTVKQTTLRVRNMMTAEGTESLLDAGVVKVVQSVEELKGILGRKGVKLADDWQKRVEKQRQLSGLRAAIKDPETGKIYSGWSHQAAIDKAPMHGTPEYEKDSGVWGRLSSEWDRSTDNVGFLDERGNFVSRSQAEKKWGILTMEDRKDALNVKYAKNGSILGATFQGISYLVSDNLNRTNTASTLIHELTHGEIQENGWKGLLGNRYDRIMAQVERMRQSGHKGLTDAYNKAVAAGTQDSDLQEETIAYFVGNAANQKTTLFQRIMQAINSWLIRKGIKRNITADDLVDLAQTAIRRRAATYKESLQVDQFADTGDMVAAFAKEYGISVEEAQRQYDEVVRKFRDTTQWMKAPNGKPTKLNERQWVQVRTPAFKKWFGDWENSPKTASKVVDENGEPLVVYHGKSGELYIPQNIEQGAGAARDRAYTIEKVLRKKYGKDIQGSYNTSKWKNDPLYQKMRQLYDAANSIENEYWVKNVDLDGPNFSPEKSKDVGVHFTGDVSVANKFSGGTGAVYPVFIKGTVVRVPDIFSRYQGLELALNELVNVGVISDAAAKKLSPEAKKLDRTDYSDEREWGLSDEVLSFWKKINKNIKNNDTVLVYENEVEGGGDSFAAFSPNQIKSAIGNTGQFSPYTDDIRFSKEEVIKHARSIYSKLQQVAADKFTGMKAQGVINFLNKQGVKKVEMDAVGIPEWLAAKKPTDKVTQQELNDFVQANAVELKDVVLGGDVAEAEIDTFLEDESGEGFTRDEAREYLRNDEGTATTQFAQYQEPGAEEGSYREMFVTAPISKNSEELLLREGFDRKVTKAVSGAYRIFFVDIETDKEYKNWSDIPNKKASEIARAIAENREYGKWQDGHSPYSDVKNPVVRIRFNSRADAQGRKILYIEEMQGPNPDNQKKMPSYLRDNLYNLGVKRILAYAKENGFDGVSWTTGEMQILRYPGMAHDVDEIGYAKNSDGSYEIQGFKEGEDIAVVQHKKVPESDLKKYVDNEVIEQIKRGEGTKDADLLMLPYKGRVGGQGLKLLYDKTLPAMFEAYAKGKVGETEIQREPKAADAEQELPIDDDGMVTVSTPFIPLTNAPESYPLFSQSGKPLKHVTQEMLDSKEFKTWQGNSMFKGKLWHGTNSEGFLQEGSWIFDSSRGKGKQHSPLAGLGNFFSLDRMEAISYTQGGKGIVRPFDVSVQNPLILNSYDPRLQKLSSREDAAAFAKRMELRGHDGIYLQDVDHVIVFDSGNIKSAETNTGDFDRSNKDVRYSIAVESVMEEVRTTSGGMSMWEKAYQYIADRHYPVSKLQGQLGRQRYDADYLEVERARGKVTAEKIREFHDDTVLPLLKYLADNNLKIEDLEELAYVEHVPEANERLKRINAKMRLDMLKKHHTEAEWREYEDAILELGGNKNEVQEGYLEIIERIEQKIPEYRQKAADMRAEYEAREFTEEEIEKGTPERALKLVENAERRARLQQQIINKWNADKDKLAGITTKEAKQKEAEWKKDERYQQLSEAVSMLREINDKRLDILHSSGELSDEEYSAIKGTYKKYVPLYREGFDEGKAPIGSGGGPLGSPVKVRAGSTRAVANVFAHTVDNMRAAIARAEKMNANETLHNLVLDNPDVGWEIGDVEKSTTYDAEGNIKLYPDLKEADNELHFKVNGERKILRVPRDNKQLMEFIDAIKGTDNAQLGPVLKQAYKFNRILAMLNTTWSPEFIMSNFSRDLQTALVNMSSTEADNLHKRVLKRLPSAIKEIWRTEMGKEESTVYRDFAKHGGKIGWSQNYENVEELSLDLEKEYAQFVPGQSAKKKLKSLKKLVESSNTAIENGVRLALYSELTKDGMNPRRAANIASNLTVDFTRRGSGSPAINALYMFFNAGVQGNVRMVKAMARSPKVRKIGYGIIAAGAANYLLGMAMGGDDDDGENRYVKLRRSNPSLFERNMIFMIPGTDGKYVKIPMPYLYNSLFLIGNEAAAATTSFITGSRYRAGEGAANIAKAIANSMNPLQAATFLQTLAPTLADPIVQAYENKGWHGGPLMPEKNPFGIPKPDSERYFPSVNVAAKYAAKGLSRATGGDDVKGGLIDISPETIEMVAETLGGSLLRFAKDTASLPVAIATGTLEPRKVPFARRVYGGITEYDDYRIYRENADEVMLLAERFKAADPKKKRELREDELFKLITFTDKTEKSLKRLNRIKNKRKASGLDTDTIDTRMRNIQEKYNKRFTALVQ